MTLLDPYASILRDRGKKPLHVDWRNKTYSDAELMMWVWRGDLHNLGVVLGNRDLVLDVDPRNGGDESYARLQKNLSLQFNHCPIVRTGGGGLHVYMRNNEQIPKLSNELTEYPGVEYKSAGRQVVAPGSTHPLTRALYQWKNKINTIPVPPISLLNFLVAQMQQANCATSSAMITPEELKGILDKLPIEQYDNNNSWFNVMAAAYHATGGAGLDEFVAWSTSDPQYSEHERIISTRWRSLERPVATKRSLATLLYEIKRHNATVPELSSRDITEELAEYKPPPSPVATIAEVIKKAQQLTDSSDATEVKAVLASIQGLEALEREDALAEVVERTKRSKSTINKALRELADDGASSKEPPDVAYEVAHKVLDDRFGGGLLLLYALDGRYWRYSGTHWEPYSADVLKGLIKKTAEVYREAATGIKFQISAVIVAAEVIIRAEVATGVDLLGAKKAPEAVVNCNNCELWIRNDGIIERKKHSPNSYLTYCLPIAFEPDATCLLFDETLNGIFAPLADKDEVIRHLWEMYGYVIQPRKSIPAWFLLQGEGSNGKSLVLDVLAALLGPTARSLGSIAELAKRDGSDGFIECVGALAIIDDDVRKGTILNDSVLKKISENKELRAKFLYHDRFSFRNCSVPLLAANHWPQTKDLSDGMIRRAYGFPFRRKFAHDDGRKDRIIATELPGVLNKALEAYTRLRQRGRFVVPPSCKKLIDEWLVQSNQVLRYLRECHNNGCWTGARNAEQLWEGYLHWADSNSISARHRYSRYGFLETLASHGLKQGNGGIRGFSDEGRPGVGK